MRGAGGIVITAVAGAPYLAAGMVVPWDRLSGDLSLERDRGGLCIRLSTPVLESLILAIDFNLVLWSSRKLGAELRRPAL